MYIYKHKTQQQLICSNYKVYLHHNELVYVIFFNFDIIIHIQGCYKLAIKYSVLAGLPYSWWLLFKVPSKNVPFKKKIYLNISYHVVIQTLCSKKLQFFNTSGSLWCVVCTYGQNKNHCKICIKHILPSYL